MFWSPLSESAIHMVLWSTLCSFVSHIGKVKHFWTPCAVLSLEMLSHRQITLGQLFLFSYSQFTLSGYTWSHIVTTDSASERELSVLGFDIQHSICEILPLGRLFHPFFKTQGLQVILAGIQCW